MSPTSTAVLARRCATAVLLVCGNSGAAVTQEAAGRVTDEAGVRPLVDVEVSLLTPDGRVVGSAVTDADGRYRIRAPEAGVYRLAADHLGYQRLETPLGRFSADRTLNVAFEMPVDPVELDGIRVEAERFEEIREAVSMFGVRAEDLGPRFVSRAEIEAVRTARNFGDVLRWQSMAGVQVVLSDDQGGMGPPVVCVKVVRGREACALTVLDGAIVDPTAAALLSPEAIEAVTVLRPAEASLVFGTEGGVGAVLLFTRRGGATP